MTGQRLVGVHLAWGRVRSGRPRAHSWPWPEGAVVSSGAPLPGLQPPQGTPGDSHFPSPGVFWFLTHTQSPGVPFCILSVTCTPAHPTHLHPCRRHTTLNGPWDPEKWVTLLRSPGPGWQQASPDLHLYAPLWCSMAHGGISRKHPTPTGSQDVSLSLSLLHTHFLSFSLSLHLLPFKKKKMFLWHFLSSRK